MICRMSWTVGGGMKKEGREKEWQGMTDAIFFFRKQNTERKKQKKIATTVRHTDEGIATNPNQPPGARCQAPVPRKERVFGVALA